MGKIKSMVKENNMKIMDDFSLWEKNWVRKLGRFRD
jgi:hypothetical protein